MKDPKEMLDEFGKSVERDRLARIRYFAISFYVFQRNAQELRKLIGWAEDPGNYLKLWDVRNRSDLDQFIHELICKVHNFVAAAKSLVDHSRNFYKKNYKSAGEFNEYEDEVRRRFIDNNLVQFVQELRDYCLHYEPPPVHCVLSYSASIGSSHRICMDRKLLLKFDGWNPTALKYLSSVSDDKVDLSEVVREYEKQISEFYQWIDSRLQVIHAKDYEVVQKKKLEILAALEKPTMPLD